MSNRPARVPNVNDLERLLRTKSRRFVVRDGEAAREFMDDFDRQIAELKAKDLADRNCIARSIDVQPLQRDNER